jgi:hypothetical protein
LLVLIEELLLLLASCSLFFLAAFLFLAPDGMIDFSFSP